MATVDMHYFAAAVRCAARGCADVPGLLGEVGVSPRLLHQPRARVQGSQMATLVQRIWVLLDDEFMGCAGRRCKRGVFALMARHALHYESLGAILEQGVHFYNLFTDAIQMRLVQRGAIAELEVEYRYPEWDPDCFYREFWLVIWHRFSSWLVGQKIPLRQVCFTYDRPAHDQELKQLFPCRHRFNAPVLKLSFAAEWLQLPCVRSQHDLSRFLRHSPADLITIPGEDTSYQGRIRALLHQQPGEVLSCPGFDTLADQFNTSTQTLRRRLKAEGTSYPEIKELVRRDLAIEMLVARKLSVAEISRRLDFSEPRSFSRAFKHWTGVSPKAYRVAKQPHPAPR